MDDLWDGGKLVFNEFTRIERRYKDLSQCFFAAVVADHEVFGHGITRVGHPGGSQNRFTRQEIASVLGESYCH